MDISRFIDSEDIADELAFILRESEDEDDELPLKYAWLIRDSDSASLKVRHEGWREIIDTIPDTEIPARNGFPRQESLHAYLQKYMALEKSLCELFFAEGDDAAYQYTVYYPDHTESDDHVFHSFEDCKHAAMTLADSEAAAVTITKRWFGEGLRSIDARFNSGIDKLMSVSPCGVTSDDETEMLCIFGAMWFSFPTPFRRGDIVQYRPPYYESEPFVLDAICDWAPWEPAWDTPGDPLSAREKKDLRERLMRGGDSSDMIAWGYFVDDKGQLYSKSIPNYIKLIYNQKELCGKSRILKALSSYMAGKIDIRLLLNAQQIILQEEAAKLNRARLPVTDDELRMAGLLEG